MDDIIFGSKRDKPNPKDVKIKKERKISKRYKNKKHNIKFPMSNEDVETLMYKAMEHNLKITGFSSMTIENELKNSHICKNYEYNKDGVLVNACLDTEHFKKVQKLSIEWKVSYRRVAHRLVKNYIDRTCTSDTQLQIISYRDVVK